MKVIIRDLRVCVDCLAFVANGQVQDNGQDITADHAAKMHSQWGTDLRNMVPACQEECEGWFSWWSCDGCGSTLGGERHPAAVLAPEDDPRPDVPAPDDPDHDNGSGAV